MSWNNNNKIIRRHDSSRTEPMSFIWHGKQTREREKRTRKKTHKRFVVFCSVWLAASLKDFCRIFSVCMKTQRHFMTYSLAQFSCWCFTTKFIRITISREKKKKWSNRGKGTTENRQHRKDEKEKRISELIWWSSHCFGSARFKRRFLHGLICIIDSLVQCNFRIDCDWIWIFPNLPAFWGKKRASNWIWKTDNHEWWVLKASVAHGSANHSQSEVLCAK